MRDKLGPGTTLSYCTNVHPILDLQTLIEQIREHAVKVKELVSPNAPMGIGVWSPYSETSNPTLRHLLKSVAGRSAPTSAATALSTFQKLGLEPVTVNAFPFHAFHDEVIKHRVYLPDWTIEDRVWHVCDLAQLVSRGNASQRHISLSTLPIGFERGGQKINLNDAASRLCQAASDLYGPRENATKFTIDLEPEPGCILDTADKVIAFFDRYLASDEQREAIGVCHDICHAAVMFEDQREVLRRYAEAGIRVNKVQISSALDVDVRAIGVETAIEHLRPFAEPRYLHQTGFMTGGEFELIEDLPEAIERLEDGATPDRLRVHFHVPIYLDQIGPLGTTNNQIADAIAAAREYHDTKHFEVETYAWGVLPEELKRDTLAEGIADELKWVLNTSGHLA